MTHDIFRLEAVGNNRIWLMQKTGANSCSIFTVYLKHPPDDNSDITFDTALAGYVHIAANVELLR